MQRFRGRTVLITGAGGAIGRAAATRFARRVRAWRSLIATPSR